MNAKDVVIGMKVVVKSKTVPGWEMDDDELKKTKYKDAKMYVISKPCENKDSFDRKNSRTGLLFESDIFVLSFEKAENSGSYFKSSDFEPCDIDK